MRSRGLSRCFVGGNVLSPWEEVQLEAHCFHACGIRVAWEEELLDDRLSWKKMETRRSQEKEERLAGSQLRRSSRFPRSLAARSSQPPGDQRSSGAGSLEHKGRRRHLPGRNQGPGTASLPTPESTTVRCPRRRPPSRPPGFLPEDERDLLLDPGNGSSDARTSAVSRERPFDEDDSLERRGDRESKELLLFASQDQGFQKAKRSLDE